MNALPPATTVKIVPDCARLLMEMEPVVTVTVSVVAATAMGTGPVNIKAKAKKQATPRKNGCNGLGSR